MDKNNHEELDLKIKEALSKNDNIVVPKKISKGIDETLGKLDDKKDYSIRQIIMVSSIAIVVFILCTPPGVEAIKSVKNALYTYIPGMGTTINADELIYTLKKPVTKSIGKRHTTLNQVFYNTESKIIIVDVEGNGKLPEDNAILKINNKKIKSHDSSLRSVSNTGRNVSWEGSYFFKYNKAYSNENIEFKIKLENGETVEINCTLEEAKHVTDITELGPSTTNKGITITSVVEEEGDVLNISFLDNLKDENIGISYGEWSGLNSDDGTITLTDTNNKTVIGKQIMNDPNNYDYNKFEFNIEGLQKPFKVTIPQVGTYMHDEVSSSEIIELPIPTESEELIVDKNVSLEIKNKIIEGSNTDVEIVSIKREEDNLCTIKLQYFNPDKINAQLVGCVIVPAGESTSPKAKDWFEDGLSGGLEDEYIRTLTFKLPYPNDNKLYIKIKGSEYKIIGPWEIIID